eukprot:6179687-Pleurochrysis_carterae.AAC.2
MKLRLDELSSRCWTGVQLVVFGTDDCPVCEEARGMASYLGPPLLHVYAANCSRLAGERSATRVRNPQRSCCLRAGTDAAGTERRNASNDGPDGEGDDNASAGDLCILEGVRWAPEVKLYPSGSGLGRGLSLLGRPFASTDQMGAALEAAKTTAQVLKRTSRAQSGRVSQSLAVSPHTRAHIHIDALFVSPSMFILTSPQYTMYTRLRADERTWAPECAVLHKCLCRHVSIASCKRAPSHTRANNNSP